MPIYAHERGTTPPVSMPLDYRGYPIVKRRKSVLLSFDLQETANRLTWVTFLYCQSVPELIVIKPLNPCTNQTT